MKCLCCAEVMIHGGDHDLDDDDEHLIVSNFTCPSCAAFALFYVPRPEVDAIE